jgi:hypothetical protein
MEIPQIVSMYIDTFGLALDPAWYPYRLLSRFPPDRPQSDSAWM